MKAKKDNWLSEVLKRQAYTLSDENLTVEELVADLNKIKSDGKAFITAKVSPQNLNVIKILVQNGFHLIDTNVVFSKKVEKVPFKELSGIKIRFAEKKDEEATVKLGASVFSQSRFHKDSQLKKEEANRVKAEWVRSYFLGRRGEAMVLAEDSTGKIIGFLQLINPHPGSWIIDLIGITEGFRGQGLGASMVLFAEASCDNVQEMIVGTQLINTASIASYQKMGFLLQSAQYVFHFHH